MLEIFLELEKSKYLHENELSLGSSSFSRDFLLCNMSHEIRTPLNGIIGYIQLFSKTKLTDVQNKYVNSINHCCFQLMQIVNDVLDYTKLTTNKVNLNEECFNIQDLTVSIKDILATQLSSKKQKLIFKISNEIPEFLYADKSKIIQVLLNLLSNAHKFSSEGKEIKVKISNRSNNILLFRVIDRGIGISEKDKHELFHVFSQLKNNTVKLGTGLGLAISKKLVELMGGTIWLTSKVGYGSTFYFTIKTHKYENIDQKIEDNISLIKGTHVLIVDDNATNRMLLSDYIFEWKMHPVTCASGMEAMRLVINNRYKFGIALIDICMPEMNGIELAKSIKKEHSFPLIALNSDDSYTSNNYFDKRIDKPIHKFTLFNSIFSLLMGNVSEEYRANKITNQINFSHKINSPRKKDSKILIAEDISYNLTLLVNILNSLKYKNIDTAYDGKNTIEMLDNSYKNKKFYNILLLDLKMPRIDGYEVIEYIKKKNYKIIVIVISASVLDEEVTKCKNKGIKWFVPKPIEIKTLKKVLYEAIEDFYN